MSGRQVEVYGCSGEVEVRHRGELVATHPRGTEHRVILDPGYCEGEATERALPPPPLGRIVGS